MESILRLKYSPQSKHISLLIFDFYIDFLSFFEDITFYVDNVESGDRHSPIKLSDRRSNSQTEAEK